MSQAIQLQVTQVGLEQSIAAAMKRVGSSSQINLGTNSRQINALSQPLGRITGQADEFSKSMEAANARVLAFGASAGIIAGVSKAMAGLVSSTIKVEKSLVEIGSVLNKTGADLDKFGQDIFNVAKNTGQSFDEVAKGALELSRQGLNAEDTLARLNDALILSRLSGLDATQSVEGLTAAFNSFQKSGITTAEILNKVVAVSQKYAVSERDIIEGLKRSAAVADLAGVSFEELAALITAVQQKTARGGAVIGNAFKTIFSRLQDKAVLSDLQDIGIAVTDLQGNVLPALKILESLAGQMDKISQIEQADIAKKLGGVYQLDKLLAALKDLSSEASVTQGALEQMGKAGDSAYKKNAVLNETLSALINKVAVSAEQLGAKLGDIGVTDSLKNILGFFNNLLEGIQNILGEESGLGNLVRGLVKGLGNFLAGPGLALFGGIILKLSKDLVQFGFASLKAFFGIGKAAKDVQNVEGAISQILAKNVGLQQQLFALEGNRAAQLRLITGALVEQEALLRRSANISSGLAAPLYNVGARATSSGLRVGNSAGGYMPTVAKESKAIKQGVGGARSGDKPVVMPNFNFGGGKKGTMVAHTGEYVVPNFNGSGGSAVFNRRMVQSMGLPSGAKKIGAAGGFVPNFARGPGLGPAELLQSIGATSIQDLEQYRVFKNDKPTKAFNVGGDIVRESTVSNALKPLGNVYNANSDPKTIMLLPETSAYSANGLRTVFANKREVGGKVYNSFDGGYAGLDPQLKSGGLKENSRFRKLSNIDDEMNEALAFAASRILNSVSPDIKTIPKSLNKDNIGQYLEAGGAGALGSIRGALFESVINIITGSIKDNEQGTLDVSFGAGDNRAALEELFGVEGKNVKYADFKNSLGQKDKFIDQTMRNFPNRGGVNAAGGYIPNFSKYIYDSDRLNPDKGATLAAVLSSKAKKNLLIGPAGSGKSTFAGKSGQFLSGIDDVPKATEIDILSGAARAKGGLSKSLESIIAAVNSSGGKVSYLYTKNLEILSRRRSRTSPSEGDLRSIKQLKGTRYAPLNQFDFLSNVKSKSKNFNLIQGAAGGYIPNFAAQRSVGYLDGDVLNDPRYAETVKAQIAKLGIKGGAAEYHKYLGDLAAQARSSGKLKKFTSVFGVPGAGKSTMMFGGGMGAKADSARLRTTNRIPIITPEDISKVSEIVDTRASLVGTANALEGGYLSKVDRMMILSSSTKGEQEEIKRRRNLRDSQIQAGTSATAFGRTVGTSQGASLDSGYIEAMALSILGKDKVSIMGVDPSFKLKRKRGNQLPIVENRKIGLAYGAFSPSTKGHAELLKMAEKEGISPENFIAAVSKEGGTIDQNDPHSWRTSLFPQGFRKFLMQKTVPGANVVSASSELFAGSIPKMFETSRVGDQRRFIKAQQGSLAFVGSDKTDKDLEKYIKSGYDVRVGDRTDGVSGTAARDAINNLDSKSIAKIFTQDAAEVINKYLPQMKSRSDIFPEIIKRVNSKVDNQLNPIEQALSLLPARKSKNTPPEISAQMDELREAKDKLKKLKQKIPDVMLRKLESLFPNKYGLPSAAEGFVPNFVAKSREVGRGVQGAFYKLGNQKDGTQVGVKKFFKDGPSRAVEFEWLVAEYLSKHTKIPAVFGPKNLSTLQDSVRKQSIRKELVSDPLAKNALGSQVSEMFGRGVLFNALQAQGLSIGDLHGSNYTVNANAEKAINELGNFPQNATGAFSTLRDMASKGSRIGILDTGAAKVSEPARTAIGNILKMASQSKASAAGGFVPNFAGEAPNRGIKTTALQIAKGLGKMAIKMLIDQYLGDGVLDSMEASGLGEMRASDAKVFMAELSKPTKGKHRRAFERALLQDSEMQKAHPDYYRRLLQQGSNSAGGFMPNFANPLQAAVGREMSAGVPASQIYIDKSPALKNAGNPMGLMVANRRDEPSGGFQGISRARREGANPMMYGAAGGFVPNYAAGNDSGGTSKVLATLFLFQTAVSVASGFFEQAGESGKKLSETLQKIASTALIFGGIAFSGPIKRLKEFADQIAKTRKAARDSTTDGFYKGYRSGKVGNPTFNLNASGRLGGTVGRGVASVRETASNIGGGIAGIGRRVASSPIGQRAVAIGQKVGSVGRTVGAVGGFVGRGIGAAGVAAGGLLGPITLAVGGFKVVGEALSGFRTYSNAAAKSLGQISVYAAKASESLSELDKTAIEAVANRKYGVTGGTLLGSISDITGASALASGISGQQISNTNYRGKNVELSNVSEDTFKQIEKAFITSYVGANRTKFATAEDASGVAALEFSEKFKDAFDEFDAESIKDQIKTLSEEAQRFQKDNAVAEALKQAKIQSELATRDIINFNNVLGDSANKIIQLKAKVFELKSSNEIFKAVAEASIENASNLSEFEKVAQKLGTTLQSLDASKAVQELDLIAKTTENIDNTIKTNLKGLTVQDVGLGELYSEIKDLITSGNVEGINDLINDTTKGTGITKLFGGDSRDFLREQTKEFNAQTTEIKNQAKEAQNNANIEAYRLALAQQTTSALESQTKQLDFQKSSLEKMSEYADKIKASTSKISDLNFEKGLIGATQRQRLSAQIDRRPELEKRVREESLRNFQKDRISSVQSLESLIPSTLSSESQFNLKTGILDATKSIRNKNTLGGVAEEANKRYAETVQKINQAVQEETSKRSDFINEIKDSLIVGSVTFKDSVVGAAQEFARIIKVSAQEPKIQKRNELVENRNQLTSKIDWKKLTEGKKSIERYNTANPNVSEVEKAKNMKRFFLDEPEVKKYLEYEKSIDNLQKEIDELNANITNYSPIPTTMTSSLIPTLLKKPVEAPKIKTLPTSPPEGLKDPLEAARLDQKASLLEIANTTENAADELQKLTSVSRILADEFVQLKDGITAAIAAIISQRNKSISGKEIISANYDLETQRQLAGANSEEEANKITRDRQVKSVSQLFAEEYGKTPEEQALDLKKTIVDGSVQFKNNMIEGIMGAVEGTSSLKDGLRSAAYEFIKSINQKMMSNLVDKVVGGNVESGTGQTGGGIVGFLSNMFASGGKVTGGSGSKDDVPAMLMGGEYVVNKKAVSKYGAQFMESINSGTLSGYAKGGKVQSGPQGNFYTPGTFGQGSIEGKRNLLDFATQSGTSGQFDQMTNSGGYQSIFLEPESSRLSVSGMRNSPMFDATQSAKGQAFDLYLQQYNAEREAKKQAKEQKKALTKQLIMLVASTALGGIGKAAMTGGSNAVKALGENAKFLDKAGAFFGGMYKGGDIGDGIMGGGLKNLFSGNFGLAYQSDILKASPVSDVANGYTGTGPAAQGSGAFRATSYGLASIDKTTAMDQQKADAGNPLYKGFSQTIGASGRKLMAGYSVASNFYPLGTILNIGGKEYQVDDTGGMSKNVIDFFAGGDKNLYKQFASLGNINPQVVSKKAIGGMIPSTSGVDTVPAMLSGGEFVMNRSAVQGIGASNLQSMNSGGTSITSEETSKELNEKLLAKLDELINSSGSAGNITINVAPSGQTTQENSQDPSAGRQQLARQIKDAVLQIINDEKRIGGSLRR